jgi:hypothetical protein
MSPSRFNRSCYMYMRASPPRGRISCPNPKIDATCLFRTGGPKIWGDPYLGKFPKLVISHRAKWKTYPKLMAGISPVVADSAVHDSRVQLGSPQWIPNKNHYFPMVKYQGSSLDSIGSAAPTEAMDPSLLGR